MKAKGSAGNKGKSVRGDCWIEIEAREEGGIQIQLESKVKAIFGDAICAQVASDLAAAGVEHAEVTMVDAGALPYIITARIEAALRRAGLNDCEAPRYALEAHAKGETSKGRFRRSRLYLPGNTPKFFLNAGLHEPDGVILDLEDSVAPAEKDAAQFLVRNALCKVNFYGAERMVRINQLPRGLEDLDYLIPHNVHVLLIPKCEGPEQVMAVVDRVNALKGAHGIEAEVYLMPIIESALGALKAFEIATASPTVCALAIGLEDYTADLGVQRTNEGRESFWMRSQVIAAARAAGVQPIDTVFSDVSDMEGLRESVLEAKSLGFDGKGCIHPRQIAVIHDAMAPDQKAIDKAIRIVKAFEEADAKGLGVVSLGSKMIDPPVVKRALHTVELAVAAGRLDANWRAGD